MNRELLSKKILFMRKYVKQARVHMVRKLLRKAHVLREKKGDDEMKKKFQRKAGCLVEEVLALKKLKDDDISRFALLGAELNADYSASDVQHRVLKKIATYKVLANQVAKFQREWPNCQTVPVLLATPKNKHSLVKKTEALSEKFLVSKPKCTLNKKEQNSKTRDSKPQTQKGSDHDFISVADSRKSLSLHEVQAESWVNLSSAQSVKSRTGKKSMHGLNKKSVTDIDGRNVSVDQFSAPCKNSGRQNKEKKTKKCPLLTEDPIHDSVDTCPERGDKSSLVPAIAKDPFFMGPGDNRHYNNTPNPQKPEIPVYSDGLNRTQRRLAVRTSHDRSSKALRKGVKNKVTKKLSHHPQVKKNDRLCDTAAKVSLHPSWEAKKRLQEQQKLTVPFQGKKIKFDDD